ncbi:hypothetical protein Slin15195_G063930 [Septoria linicola]|uniref:Uncharacterized protein n=1 Tax=Septoria linicola TaxID=215465 RepID=A0A9Q9APH7_9PEZI|nr:hypothetical protein Slin15195_G063930 [Septoria linicola]
MSTSTAAFQYSNGTTVVLGRVDGDQAYKDFWTEISFEDSRHPSPPYYKYFNASADAARQWQRHYRKQSGRPASTGVEALTHVLARLIGPTNDTLGAHQPLRYATTAVPAVPAIYTEDPVDAAQYLGLNLVLGRSEVTVNDDESIPLSDINYALVGMEFSDRKWKDLSLSISYTDDLFTIHATDDAYSGIMWKKPVGVARADLGHKHLNSFPTLDDYWNELRRVIHDVLGQSYFSSRRLRPVIVHGERAMDSVLRAILQHELDQLQWKGENVSLHSIDSVYAGAIGRAGGLAGRWSRHSVRTANLGLEWKDRRYMDSGIIVGSSREVRAMLRVAWTIDQEAYGGSNELHFNDQVVLPDLCIEQERIGVHFIDAVNGVAKSMDPSIDLLKNVRAQLADLIYPPRQVVDNHGLPGFGITLDYDTNMTESFTCRRRFSLDSGKGSLLYNSKPFQRIAKENSSVSKTVWENVPWGNNVITTKHFALWHAERDEQLRVSWWSRLWFHPREPEIIQTTTPADAVNFVGQARGMLRAADMLAE